MARQKQELGPNEVLIRDITDGRERVVSVRTYIELHKETIPRNGKERPRYEVIGGKGNLPRLGK